VIPSLKVHLELKVFNTHVRVYKMAASWKLRKGMYHPKLLAKGNQGFVNLSCSADSIISLITVENQFSSWDDMRHSLHDLTLVCIYHVSADSLGWIVFWSQLHSCLVSGPLLEKSIGDWECKAQCFLLFNNVPYKVVLMLHTFSVQSACVLTFQ
jgi:hypothetical protein